MSDFANTEHRPAIVACRVAALLSVESSSMVSWSLRACCSRNEPVPAAQASLVENSRMQVGSSGSKTMNFHQMSPKQPGLVWDMQKNGLESPGALSDKLE